MLTTGIQGRTEFLALLNNAGHAPIFGLLAWIILSLLKRARVAAAPERVRPYLTAFGITLALGAVVELAQSAIGRGASLFDLVMDGAGAAFALGVIALARLPKGPTRLHAALAALVLLAATVVLAPLAQAAIAYARRAAVFPAIAVFEDWRDLYFIAGAGSAIAIDRLPEPWAAGRELPALRIRYLRESSPGLRFKEPAANWRGYADLCVDLTNPGPRPLRLMIRIHDRAHDQRHEDRFNLPFELQAGSRRLLRIPLRDVAAAPDSRRLDLAQVAGIVIFERGPRAPQGSEFYLRGLWLE